MKTKILFDGYIFKSQKTGGINRYFTEIIKGLPGDWVPTVTGVRNFGMNIPVHPHLQLKAMPDFRPRRYQRYLQKWWNPGIIRSAELVHPTYYELTNGMKITDFRCPVVVTVHDLIHARFPKLINKAEALIHAQRAAVLRADRIICVSESTKRDLLELIPESAGKISIIYLGSSMAVSEEKKDNIQFTTPTFLFVGARIGYKNFQFLLRAFAKAASVSPNIRLQVAGAPFTEEERWQIFYLGISEKVSLVIYPDEAALQSLYHESVALLYPSRYEGFGIPPVEAMACGTLAVTGNTSSLPEVIGDAGIMLDPADENAWAECIIKLAQPFSGRRELLDKGRARATQFSWPVCVRKHLEVYNSSLGR